MMEEPIKEIVHLPTLTQQIEKWLKLKENMKIQCSFKYPTTFLKSLNNQLMVKILLYSCLKELKSFISGQESQKDLKIGSLAFDLKESYYQMNVKGIWSDTFNFQFSLIYFVKIVASFCNYFFKEVEIDNKFEGQIFIILVHVFLGANVSHKSYKILQRKFIGKSTFKTLKKKKLLIKESKIDEIGLETSEKDEIKVKSLADDFKDDLLASLYVEPLPKLQIKRKSLQSFTLPRNSLEEFALNRKLERIELNLKKRIMKSTQLSTSMEVELKKYKSFVAMNTKPFKINHRLPFNGSDGVWRKKQNMMDMRQTPLLSKLQDEKQNYKIDFREWLKIINKMKDEVVDENAKMQYGSLYPIQDKKTSSEEEKIEQYSTDNFMNFNKEEEKKKESQKNEKMLKNIHKKQYPLERKMPKSFDANEDIEKEKNTNKVYPNSKQFKMMKKKFEEGCQERINKIEYSIFMLPGLKNHDKLP